MRRPIDSLFGRLVVLVIGVLVLSHLAWFTVIRLERDQTQTRYAVEEAAFLVDAVRQHIANSPDQPLPSSVRVVEPSSPDVPKPFTDVDTNRMPAPFGRFIDDLRDRLPDGTDVRVGEPGGPPRLWVRSAKDANWIVVPVQPLRPPRSRDRMLLWLAIIFSTAVMAALFAAWQLQTPLRSLAQAVGRFGRGEPTPPVPERGPRELRQLTHGFNQMVREVEQTESDRAVMLAGVAHDLRAPITRIQVRANLVPSATVRDGFFHDTESLAQIVTQFLDFARDTEADTHAPWISVDAFCRAHYAEAEAGVDGRDVLAREPLFELDLQAGDDFRLPAVELDRILSNLVENAFTYGAPPLCIATSRGNGRDRLSVRDHGKGMPEAHFARALRPFVRLDPARGGDAHCGLGLTIVRRLTRRYGGDLSMHNADGSGLAVVLDFPSRTPA